MSKICVMGLGYIGLPTAVIAALHGCQVLGFDIDASRVDRINAQDTVIDEPKLKEHFIEVIKQGLFKATTRIKPADYFIIAVPTPFLPNKQADLSYAFKAADILSGVLKKGNTVILESTVPVGTTDNLAHYIAAKTGLKVGEDFYVAYCPERVLPGKIMYELIHNNRIIGGIDKQSIEKATFFYKKFVLGNLYLTNTATAEIVKLVENSSRDVALAFSNQVASMAEAFGLNPYEVIELANKHPRVSILRPTCGVGGHCIAVDPWFLIETFGPYTQLLQMARHINDAKPFQVMHTIRSALDNWQLTNAGLCKIMLLGLTYKQDIDDMRESPALIIAQHMTKWPDCQLVVCDPHVRPAVAVELTQAVVVSFDQGFELADIIICLVAHSEFQKQRALLKTHSYVLDVCGLLHEEQGNNKAQQEHIFWPAQVPKHESFTSLKKYNSFEEQA